MNIDRECLFCRIIAGEIPGAVVYADDYVVAFRDIQPAAPTHVLIAPRKHITSLHDIGTSDRDLPWSLVRAAQQVAEIEGVSSSGYRVVTNVGSDGGQSVDHLHFHVLGGRQLTAMG